MLKKIRSLKVQENKVKIDWERLYGIVLDCGRVVSEFKPSVTLLGSVSGLYPWKKY